MSPWKIILPIIVTSAAACLPAMAQPPAERDTKPAVKTTGEDPQAMNKKEMAEKLAKTPMVASEDELVGVKAPVASEDELVAAKAKVKPDPVSEMAKEAVGAKARKAYPKKPHEATHIIQQGAGHEPAEMNKGAVISEIAKDGAEGKAAKRMSFEEAVSACRGAEDLQACVDEKTGQVR